MALTVDPWILIKTNRSLLLIYTRVPWEGIPLGVNSVSFFSCNFLSSSSDGNKGGRSFPTNSTMPILAMSLFRGGILYTRV